MQITIDDGTTTATVVLTGRLDIAGAEAVALPLATLSGAKSSLVIDMAGVSFIASIGLRHLVTAAKSLRRRGTNTSGSTPMRRSQNSAHPTTTSSGSPAPDGC